MGGPQRQRLAGWIQCVGLAVIGLAFCALGLGMALVYWHNQSTFQARAVPGRAVIDQISSNGAFPMTSYGGGYYYDRYGLVHFEAQGRTAHAQVLLDADCSSACLPLYHTGQVVTVYYNPQNPTYAQLNRPTPEGSGGLLLALYLIPVFPLLGLTLIAAAIISLVTVVQDHPRVKARRRRRPPSPSRLVKGVSSEASGP